MNSSLERLGVEIDELSTEEIKSAVNKIISQQKCESCKFIFRNNSKLSEVISCISGRKDELIKKFPTLSLSIFCENYFQVDENKKFLCDFSKYVTWSSLSEFEAIEVCPICGKKLLATCLLMNVSGLSVETFCPKCLSKRRSSQIAEIL